MNRSPTLAVVAGGLLALVSLVSALPVMGAPVSPAVFPGRDWVSRDATELSLQTNSLERLRQVVGGRGCVVRYGYLTFSWGEITRATDVASAMKPVLTTLLLMAVQEGWIKSVDGAVADFEPRLMALNHGKDASITWRHLAFQTSGYGLAEKPGEAYSYNDFALALYYDTLTRKVFGEAGTEVFGKRLAEPLGFQDAFTFEAFGPENRPGRLAMSPRDFARLGLLYLRQGRWRDAVLLKPELLDLAIHSPLDPRTPLTSGREADMLSGQRSIGGTRNITPVGPGYYSFNWWLNGTNRLGQRLVVDAPADSFMASGHGGRRVLWLFPGWDLIVCWNDSVIEDHDQSPGNASSRLNQAAACIRDAVSGP